MIQVDAKLDETELMNSDFRTNRFGKEFLLSLPIMKILDFITEDGDMFLCLMALMVLI